MSTEKLQPPQSEETEPVAEPAPKPTAQAEARELAVDDVESDGADVKGGGIATSILDVAGLHATSSRS